MANVERLKLMVTMLREVEAGTWKPAAVEFLEEKDGYTTIPAEESQKIRSFFDLSTWLSTDGDARTCGYSACAIGHACLDQRFIDQGLTLVRMGYPQLLEQDEHGHYYSSSWAAVTAFFDFEEEGQAAFFFDPDHYPKGDIRPGQVADRIEQWLKEQA